MKMQPDCHPDRRHYGHGMCSACYQLSRYNKDKEKSRWAFRSHDLNQSRRANYTEQRALENRTRKRRRIYGISDDHYEQMLLNQDGRCCLCHDDDCLNFHTDHDPQTNKVRGLLCSNCNTGLGKLGDNIVGLRRAVRYLEHHACGS